MLTILLSLQVSQGAEQLQFNEWQGYTEDPSVFTKAVSKTRHEERIFSELQRLRLHVLLTHLPELLVESRRDFV